MMLVTSGLMMSQLVTGGILLLLLSDNHAIIQLDNLTWRLKIKFGLCSKDLSGLYEHGLLPVGLQGENCKQIGYLQYVFDKTSLYVIYLCMLPLFHSREQ
jgi:hypothetical protein